MATEYILQRRGSCCGLIALLNAARFHGLDTPAPSDKEYGALVDMARCRHGSALDYGKAAVAEHLGLRIVPMTEATEIFPFTTRVVNPEPRGMYLHETLVIGIDGEAFILVNYRWKGGPVVERVRSFDIEMPPPHLRAGFHVALAEDTERETSDE